MAVNDKVTWVIKDIPHDQLAPSKDNQTEFVPGKATSLPLDANWPEDFRIPQGTPAFDEQENGTVNMERTRTTLLGRNIISDQTIQAPITGTPQTIVIEDDATWGVGVDPEYEITPTDTQENNGVSERISGDDVANGLP
jgi:hypothetical protein